MFCIEYIQYLMWREQNNIQIPYLNLKYQGIKNQNQNHNIIFNIFQIALIIEI